MLYLIVVIYSADWEQHIKQRVVYHDGSIAMNAIDFSRSFLTFRVDVLKKPPVTVSHKPPFTLNNARIPLDCRCEIVEKRTGRAHEFVLGVSCKTERVGVEQDIWTDPNADFVPIMSREQFLLLKTFDRAGKQVMLYPPSLGVQPERQVGRIEETFDSVRFDVAYCGGEVLETADRIVEATLSNHPLVARTRIEGDRYTAILDYPVKTINANERDTIYQPDTGPVLFPDLSREPVDLIGGFELAFIAFNTPHWAEFLVRVPTQVAEGVSVYHYSRPVRLETDNQIIRLV
jgi:hypothetical protein